jgi:hypothetical protein
MKRIVIALVRVASLAGVIGVQSYASEVGTEKPIVMEKFEVSAPALDLNPDRDIDPEAPIDYARTRPAPNALSFDKQ